jgi:hypothetical protein
MAEIFSGTAGGLESFATGGFAITPSDTVDMTKTARGIYVGAGGDVKIKTWDGSVITLVGCPQGAVIPYFVSRVYATGTTATSLIGNT